MQNRIRISLPSGLNLLALLLALFGYLTYTLGSAIFKSNAQNALSLLVQPGQIADAVIAISIIYCILLILFFVKPIPGASFWSYFAINKVKPSQLLFWCGTVVVFNIVTGFFFIQGEPLHTWWASTLNYRNTPLITWYAYFLILSPILEELFLRGGLFTCIEKSSLGGSVAVLLTAYLGTVPFSDSHFYLTALIFILGILLGIARIHTKSAITPIIMHFINNLFNGLMLVLFIAH